MPVSASTLLRFVRNAPLAERLTPRVLGVDDWSLRKGQVYDAILVDLEQHRPVDLLSDRFADTLARWLQAHPGVEIISRDCANDYAEGASVAHRMPSRLPTAFIYSRICAKWSNDCWHVTKLLCAPPLRRMALLKQSLEH